MVHIQEMVHRAIDPSLKVDWDLPSHTIYLTAGRHVPHLRERMWVWLRKIKMDDYVYKIKIYGG